MVNNWGSCIYDEPRFFLFLISATCACTLSEVSISLYTVCTTVHKISCVLLGKKETKDCTSKASAINVTPGQQTQITRPGR